MSNKIQSLSGYIHEYQKSVNEPEKFWARIANSFHWHKPWDKVLSWSSEALMLNGLKTQNSILQRIFLKDTFLLMVIKPPLYGSLTIRKSKIE